MNILNIEEYSDEVIHMNADVAKAFSEVIYAAAEAVGEEYFALAVCGINEEQQLAA